MSRRREAVGVFTDFFVIGATAFGGGSATLVAIQRLCLKRGWLDKQEFLDALVLSRVTPGISILAQVYLIGRHVCGWRGVVAGTLGLMLPAGAITVALARGYTLISGDPAAATPIACVIAAAAGFAVAMSLLLLRDTVATGRLVRSLAGVATYALAYHVIGNPVAVLGSALVVGFAVPRLFADRLPPYEQ